MKPYQHHDDYHDIGKATPVAKAPNSSPEFSRYARVLLSLPANKKRSTPRPTRASKVLASRNRKRAMWGKLPILN